MERSISSGLVGCVSRGARGPRDDVADLRRTNVRALQTAIASACASSAETTAGWICTSNALYGDQKSTSVLIYYATRMGAADMAHEARSSFETAVVAQGAPVAAVAERRWR